MRSNTRSFSAVAGKRGWDPQTAQVAHWSASKRPTTPSYRMARGGGPNMGTAAGAATGGAAGGASALHGTAVAGAGTAHHNGYTNYTSAGGTSGQHPHHDHVHGTASSGGNVKPVSAAHEQHQQHHNITAGHRVLHLLAKRPHSAFNTNRKRVRPVMDGGPDRKLRERPKSGDHRHHLHMNMTHHPNLQLTFNATADSADQHQQTFHGATSAGGAAAHALHTGGAPGSSSGAGGGPGATHHPGIATAMDYRRYMDRRAQAEKARHRRPTSSGAGGGYAQWNQTTPAGYEHMGGGGMDHVGATTRRPSTSGAGGAGTRTSSSAVGGNIHHHSDGLHHTTATSSSAGKAQSSVASKLAAARGAAANVAAAAAAAGGQHAAAAAHRAGRNNASSSATEQEEDGVSTRSGTAVLNAKTASTSLASLVRDQISHSNATNGLSGTTNTLSGSLKNKDAASAGAGVVVAGGASATTLGGGDHNSAASTTIAGNGHVLGQTALPFSAALQNAASNNGSSAGDLLGGNKAAPSSSLGTMKTITNSPALGAAPAASSSSTHNANAGGAAGASSGAADGGSSSSANAGSSAGGAASASGQQAQRQYGEPITLRPTGAIPHQSSGNNQHDAARPTTAPGGASKPGHANQNTASGNLNQREHDSWHQDDGAGDTYGGALANINTSTTIHDYIIGKQIGQGAYATVRLAVHKPSGKKVAIKIYEKSRLLDPQRRKSVRREIRVMDRLSHPNIVKFYEVADTSRQVFLVLEYVNGGSLHYLLKKRANRRLSEIDARMIFSQVCAGIRYCHERLVVHRDIKLENVLVQYPDKAVAHNQNLALTSSGHLDPRQLVVKLIDFGFASLVVPGKKLRVFCGTPSYMAPEIIQRKEYGGYCVDIWALGILLYAMLFGQFPFRGQSDKELYKKILKGAFTFPEGIEAEVSKNARALLVKTFVQMDVRPTIQNVVADPFLADSKGAFSYARPTSSQGSGHASSSGSGTGYVSGHQQHAGSSGGHGHLPGATHSRPSSSHGLNGMGGGGQTGIPLREEAIAKLEKLGYAREDILRQMKDENSHLSKLYTRFVKALNAWGK